jgi:hypothetical protein
MTKRRIGRSIPDAFGGLPLLATAPLYLRWHLRWGATDEEVRAREDDSARPPRSGDVRAVVGACDLRRHGCAERLHHSERGACSWHRTPSRGPAVSR